MPKQATTTAVTTVTVDRTNIDKAITQVATLVAESTEYTGPITNATECLTVSEFYAKTQRIRRYVDQVFKIAKSPLSKTKKELDREHRTSVDTLKALEERDNKRILAFRNADRDQRAQLEQQEREQREAAALEEQARRAEQLRQAAAEAPSKKVRKLLEEQAAILERAAPLIDPIEPIPEEQTLADGIHDRTTYSGVVFNLEALVLQVAAQTMIAKYGAPPTIVGWLEQFAPHPQAKIDLLQPVQKPINDLARALPDDLALAGVRVEKDTSLVSRS